MITLHSKTFHREAWDSVETLVAGKADVSTAAILTDTEGEKLAVSIDLWRSLDKVVAEDHADFVSVEFTNADGDVVDLRMTPEQAEALWRVLSAVRDDDAASAETRIEY